MATITTINDNDLISDGNEVINNNFTNLNNDKEEVSNKDTDTSLGGASPSDTKYASQKATKSYIDNNTGIIPATTTTRGVGKVSVAPVDSANPIFVGDNDGRVQFASTTNNGNVEIATDAEVIAGTDTGATGAKLVATPSQIKAYTPPTAYVSTEVFSGNPPSTYTDLDLSSVVGAKEKMVLLIVTNTTTGIAGTVIVKTDTGGIVEWIAVDTGGIGFRTNGTSDNIQTSGIASGASGVDLLLGSGALTSTHTVKVLAYW